MNNRWLLVTVVGLALGALSPLAAQGHRSNVTPGVSDIWRSADGAVVGFEDLAYYRQVHSVFELRADKGGEKAYLYVSWRERRFSTKRAATCGGIRYFGRYVVDTKGNAGEAWFGLEDREGAAHLKITRVLQIFETSHLVGPPLCIETSGTWSGSRGVFGGYEGTFLFNDDATLTLR